MLLRSARHMSPPPNLGGASLFHGANGERSRTSEDGGHTTVWIARLIVDRRRTSPCLGRLCADDGDSERTHGQI